MKTHKRILVLGAAGFTGRALCGYLAERQAAGEQIIRSSIAARNDSGLIECDCRKFSEVSRLIADIRPHGIYQLIGAYSKGYDDEYALNVLCSKNVFDAVLAQRKPHARILAVGSVSAVGVIKRADLPVTEEAALNPVTTYGLTKATQVLLAGSYTRMYGLDIVMARAFNIIGMNMPQQLFIGKLVAQISSYLRGEIHEITVGNLHNKRDYLDIRDVVAGYHRIMKFGKHGGMYNVGSGTSISTRNLLNLFLKEFGIPKKAVRHVPVERSGFDVLDTRCDNTKLLALGWKQTVSIPESVRAIREAVETAATITDHGAGK